MKNKLAEFSKLAEFKAAQLSNHVNVDELASWLLTIAEDKLGSAGPMEHDPRSEKARSWLLSVGRGDVLRHGTRRSVEPSDLDLEKAPLWLAEAAKLGKKLTKMELGAEERENLLGILDWMRSDQGPGLESDWSKISVKQALEAEQSWIVALRKAAKKRKLEGVDALGTEFYCNAMEATEAFNEGLKGNGPGLDKGSEGWRWVKVKSADSLDREGALMKHCVGSYAKDVASGSLEIYSLRDGDNKPWLTVEARENKLMQLKAFANGACPQELKGKVGLFLEAFVKKLPENTEASLSDDFEQAGYQSVPGLGVADATKGLSQAQHLLVEGWVKAAKLGGFEELKSLEGVFAALAMLGEKAWVGACLEMEGLTLPLDESLAMAAKLGHKDVVEMLIPVSDPKAIYSQALRWAANCGHMEILKMLIPVSDPKEIDSQALRHAATYGHKEIVDILIPVSDPKAMDSMALRAAAENGHKEVVAMLIPNSDPEAIDSEALGLAAKNGHKEVVEMLIPVSDPKAMDSMALSWSAENGHGEIVKMLMPVSDPKANDSCALMWAAHNGHGEIVKMLMPVSDPKADASVALRFAAKSGAKEVVEMLIPVSDPKAYDSEALRLASEKGHKQVVEMLIPVSDPKANDSAAFKTALAHKHGALVDLLLPVSDVSEKDRQILGGLIENGQINCSAETGKRFAERSSPIPQEALSSKLKSKRAKKQLPTIRGPVANDLSRLSQAAGQHRPS